jgi:hypothetical protein
MKPKAIFLLPVLALAAWLVIIGTACAQTETLTFDDLSFNGLDGQIPNGYGGLQWNNFFVQNTAQGTNLLGISGYFNGLVSPTNVAFNAFGGTASFSASNAFNLDSAYLTGAWNDGLQVEVQGFVGDTLTYDNTYTVSSLGPTLINFNYLGVDEVELISSGGTAHGYEETGEQFVMDNLTITVPEPATVALVGLAVSILILRGWHRVGKSSVS